MKKEPVLIVLVAIVALGQFLVGWITTGQPSAELLSALATTVGAAVTRFLVFSPKTVAELNRDLRPRHAAEGKQRAQGLNPARDPYK